MKLLLFLTVLLLSSFALRVDLERVKKGQTHKEALLASIQQSNSGIEAVPLSKKQLELAIRGDYTPLSNNLENPVIDLDNFQDLQYFGPVAVGSEGEVFKVCYDTGSGYIYVNAVGCDSACGVSEHYFDPETSSTYENTGVEKVLRYGKGQASGYISYDTVGIPGTEGVRALFVPNTKGKDNEGARPEGIVGLTPVVTGEEELLVNRLAEEGVIDAREFTTFIAHEDDKSYIDFGSNYEASDAEITFVDLKPLPSHGRQIYWSVEIDQLSAGDDEISIRKKTAILDTGTSLIGFPTQDLAQVITKLADGKQIYSIQGGFYAVECRDQSEIADLDFTFNGFTVNVASSEFVVEEQGYCIFLIMDFPMDGVMLGDQFLRGLRIIHDQEGQRVGFLPKEGHTVEKFLK